MAKLKYGDKVKVKDWGKAYTTDVCYITSIAGKLAKDVIIRFAYGDSSHYDDQRAGKLDLLLYRVLFVDENTGRTLISTDLRYGKVYCLSTSALKPIVPLYTKEELIRLVGSDFDLIDAETGEYIC